MKNLTIVVQLTGSSVPLSKVEEKPSNSCVDAWMTEEVWVL